MNSNKLKVGIIGVGRMGQLHLKKCLELDDSLELVGFYEPNLMKAQIVSTQYQIPAFDDLSRLFFEADAVIIASTTHAHFPIAKEALNAGVHVLVEKPFTETSAQAEELIQLATRKKLKLQVGFLERYRFRALSKAFCPNSPVFIEANRLATVVGREPSVDVVADLMIHDLDLALSLVKGRLTHLSAVAGKVITGHFDVANARLEFDDGSVINLNASRVAPELKRNFKVYSGGEMVDVDFVTNQSLLTNWQSQEQRKQKLELSQFDALKSQLIEFVDSIQGDRIPLVTASDGLKAMQFVSMVQDSASVRPFQSPLSLESKLFNHRINPGLHAPGE